MNKRNEHNESLIIFLKYLMNRGKPEKRIPNEDRENEKQIFNWGIFVLFELS